MQDSMMTAYHETVAYMQRSWERERKPQRRLSMFLITLGALGMGALYGVVSFFHWSPVGFGFLIMCGSSGLLLMAGLSLRWYSTMVLTPLLHYRLLEATTAFLRERAYDGATLDWVVNHTVDGYLDLNVPRSLRERQYIIFVAITRVRPAPTAAPEHPSSLTTSDDH